MPSSPYSAPTPYDEKECFDEPDESAYEDDADLEDDWRESASSTDLVKNQARWSLGGQTIEYMGTKLHMEQVPQLVVSEFRQAHSLLYDELLFGAEDIVPIEAWRLHDDLDLDDYGGSWLTDEGNAEILEGAQGALLRQIEHGFSSSVGHRIRAVSQEPGADWSSADHSSTTSGNPISLSCRDTRRLQSGRTSSSSTGRSIPLEKQDAVEHKQQLERRRYKYKPTNPGACRTTAIKAASRTQVKRENDAVLRERRRLSAGNGRVPERDVVAAFKA
ncbi:hypothetical protein AK830_g11983 [Neonectria ditissima]|uniref:Uncharacterized protein n=1 Tax=Neonectria ditissima TaxID=78410 RepID=A0A0N8H4X5_9HYPO|nr:hypothetical protein AK830_g11983 [Neonectria ditissima]